MKLGITTRSYGGISTAEASGEMARLGYTATELCFTQSDLSGWVYNGITDLSGIDGALVREKADIYRNNGIQVTALGLFTKLICDGDERDAIIQYSKKMIDIAYEAGIDTVTSECGFHPDRALFARLYEADFAAIKKNVAELALYAADKGIRIAIEPCVLDIIPSAKRMADFITQLEAEYGVTNVGVMLDMANLLANSSIKDVFEYLKSHIYYFHGKDRKINDAYGRLIGDGDIDWVEFFRYYEKYTPDIPFILEYANKDTAELARDRVLSYIGK